jgi:superfamily II DNA or RNA helicase
MEPSASMPEMSFRKNPRPGQQKAIEMMAQTDRLNVKLPTGYGKTFTACACYAVKQRQGINRVLFVFPTVSQLNQFVQDGPNDLKDADVIGPRVVIDIGLLGFESIRQHRENKASVFAITIQSLAMPTGAANVKRLLESGNWMVVVDEYHHYGVDKAWGRTVLSLNYKALLAMSATPYRPDDDGAFGMPDVEIEYKRASEELAVKRLRGHSYSYTLKAVNNKTGEIHEYTTEELIHEAGGDSPEAIEKLEITKDMRWSPSYISPLVRVPIERLMADRNRTSLRLQAIVTAMTCSHAEAVCQQIRSMYDELAVDWVGGGPNGRPDEENAEILAKFCPPKNELGIRRPTLDVLVHVGMAGEGLDAVNTTEAIFLCRASFSNRIIQIIGRLARILHGENSWVVGNVNFDSSSYFARNGYTGFNLMNSLDGNPPDPSDEDAEEEIQCSPPARQGDEDGGDWIPVKPDAVLELIELELERIDSGTEELEPYIAAMEKAGGAFAILADEMRNDPASAAWGTLREVVKRDREEELRSIYIGDRVKELKRQIDEKVSHCAREILKRRGTYAKRLTAADIKTIINTVKKREVGTSVSDHNVESLERHMAFLQNLERTIATQGVPSWVLS